MTMEIIIHSPTEDKFLKEISFNFQELKTELTNRLEKYRDLVYTDDQIKEAKGDRAILNKLITAIDNKRKEIKKKCLEPYEAFEKKINELLDLIKKPILQIDDGITLYENKVKMAKKASIQEIYDENIRNLKDLVPFERIFTEKMLNVTYKIKDIEEEIIKTIDKINVDIEVINDLKSEYTLQLKDTYLKNFNLSEALAEGTRLDLQKKKLAELEERKKEALKAQISKEEPGQTQKEPEKAQIHSMPGITYPEPQIMTYAVSFKIEATKKQILDLKDFFETNKIKYERINL